MKKLLSAILILSLLTSGIGLAQELEIRLRPDSVVFLYETIGVGSARPLYSGMIQNIALINNSGEAIAVHGGTMQVTKGGHPVISKQISIESIRSSATQFSSLQKMGVLELYDFQFQTQQYLKGLPLAATDTLQPGHALVITHQVFIADEIPDEITISFSGKQTSGKNVSAACHLPVVNHHSKNAYTFPLKGNWTTAAAPSLVSHHRWATIQEFAYDFIQLGNNNLTYKNEGLRLSDFYAYGKPVYAIGDGKVVSTLNAIEESEDMLKRPDEDEQAYLQRVVAQQQKLLMQGFSHVMGNHVIIQHANNEYSFYLHLKPGSVKVKTGDIVKQGDEIAALGNSGNSTEPHLHFHVTDGMDFVGSRSIPVRFSNIKLYPDDNGQISHIHAGQLLRVE